MNLNLRRILAVIGGIMLGMILIGLLEGLGHLIFPPPAEVNLADMEQFAAYLKQAPIFVLLWIMLAWFIGAFVGGAVASLIAKERNRSLIFIVGGMLTLSGVLKLVVLSPPLWFWLGLLVFIPGALLGRQVIPES